MIELSPATFVDFNFDCYYQQYSSYCAGLNHYSIAEVTIDTGFRLVKENVNGRLSTR